MIVTPSLHVPGVGLHAGSRDGQGCNNQRRGQRFEGHNADCLFFMSFISFALPVEMIEPARFVWRASRSAKLLQKRASLSVRLSVIQKFSPSLHAPTGAVFAPVENRAERASGLRLSTTRHCCHRSS